MKIQYMQNEKHFGYLTYVYMLFLFLFDNFYFYFVCRCLFIPFLLSHRMSYKFIRKRKKNNEINIEYKQKFSHSTGENMPDSFISINWYNITFYFCYNLFFLIYSFDLFFVNSIAVIFCRSSNGKKS